MRGRHFGDRAKHIDRYGTLSPDMHKVPGEYRFANDVDKTPNPSSSMYGKPHLSDVLEADMLRKRQQRLEQQIRKKAAMEASMELDMANKRADMARKHMLAL